MTTTLTEVQREETRTDMRAFEEVLDAKVHFYPRAAGYRISGADWPQPGDIALCGHVKETPSNPNWYSAASCTQCIRLRGLS